MLVDDGHGNDDVLHLIVEIKGYRREDAKEKKSTMETYWVPGPLRSEGRVYYFPLVLIEATHQSKFTAPRPGV